MRNVSIRKKVITYLADADEKKVKAVYTLLEKDIERKSEFKLPESKLKQLRLEKQKHLNGKTPSYTWEEVKERARSAKNK